MIATTTTLITTVRRVVVFIQSSKSLTSRFKRTIEELLMMQILLQRVRESNRTPVEIGPCIESMVRKLQAIEHRIGDGAEEGSRPRTRCGKWLRNAALVLSHSDQRVCADIATLRRRLDLMMQIKENAENEGRFDAAGVLHSLGEDAVHFWDHHFGSENLSVNFGTFAQSLEMVENRRLRKPERDVLMCVLDPDNDGSVSVYEFERWLSHFGPIATALLTTLESLFDAETMRLYDWFRPDLFQEGVVAELRDRPGRCLVRYGTGANNFVIDITDASGGVHELCVRRTDGTFQVVACDAGPDDADDGRRTPPSEGTAWLLSAIAISSNRPTNRFPSIPSILNTLHKVIVLNPEFRKHAPSPIATGSNHGSSDDDLLSSDAHHTHEFSDIEVQTHVEHIRMHVDNETQTRTFVDTDTQTEEPQ